MHRLTGFGMVPGMGSRIARFPVRHPEWSVRGILRTDIQLDHGELFGAEWRLLNDLKPAALIL